MSDPQKPNIVVIVLDTVRLFSTALWDRSLRTPWIEGFAESSVVYEQARTSSPWTLPSHASLFTGLYPSEHGVSNLSPYLPDEQPTLATSLKQGGYHTAAVSANAWVGPDFGLSQGFDRFVRGWQLVESAADLGGKSRLGGDGKLVRVRNTLAGARVREVPRVAANLVYASRRSRGLFGGDRIARLALNELNVAEPSQPTFMFINFLDAHLPYNPPRRDRRAAGLTWRATRGLDQDPFKHMVGCSELTPAQIGTMRLMYEAEIAGLDAILSEMVPAVLRRLGENTVVVVTSDHGENLGEHDLLDHQFSLHDTLLRVPLVVRFPGGEGGGTRREDMVLLQDVYETILTITGVKHQTSRSSRCLPGPSGGSPREVVMAQYATVQPEIAALLAKYPGASTDGLDRTLTAIVDPQRAKAVWGSDGTSSLYSTTTDPWETTEVADHEALERLQVRRDAELATLAMPPDHSPHDASDTDDEVRRQLEAIGYL